MALYVVVGTHLRRLIAELTNQLTDRRLQEPTARGLPHRYKNPQQRPTLLDLREVAVRVLFV